ncbi:unnamed protein product [Darwinula stevensoni]|uniref:DOMON domain-containing protein n=1 Tax=Darwinula stevensoni TaxID=69355 RepID=A0A7R8XM58_9CRUS|nr:unnamed protein product [Darwinula stevensoni]CAG0895153.1 unnamed protein product [Darwinula stevensoni]
MDQGWTDMENGEITFELHARTQGWAGLGFSANGAMTGSDIVVGWIKDGQTFFTDRHAVGNELPLVDESQDYELLFASEDEEGLTLRFKRPIDTCDEDDFYITGENYPEQTGFPLKAASEGATYYLLQVHYDNPMLVDGIYDDSGLTIYYTDNLRTYDMDTVVFGHNVVYAQRYLNLAGRKMRARIFRDGEELSWILHDENYAFDYQQSRVLREEFILLPGDHMTIECELSSSEQEDVTVGGLKTQDEMCELFAMYYPRVEGMNVCLTSVDSQYFHSTFELGGVHMNWESLEWELDATNQTIHEYFRGFNWENFDLEAYQEAVRFDPQPGICGRSPNLFPQTWERHETLDRDGIVNLFWTPDLENGVITFELHVKTQGWAGLGFSANGAMPGSDIVVGWVKDGQSYFSDRHAVGNELPLVDERQDYELLFASEDEEGLTLRFKRPIDTCDEDDFYITSDTWSVIYAFGETDPDEEDPFYHGRDNRGVKSVNLLDPQNGDIPDEPGVKEWELRNDIIIPPIDTTYWCSVFKAPPVDRKHHIIGYQPWIMEGNEAYLHHFVVATCTVNEDEETTFEQFMQDYPHGVSCFDYSINLPIQKCQNVLMAWAVGGVGENYPEQTGFPLKPTSEGATYYRLEVHYDNPMLVDGIYDDSGLTIYYTDNLRTYDMDTLVFGHNVVYTQYPYISNLSAFAEIGLDPTPNLVLFFQLVPPGLNNFMTVGHCPAECTEMLPPEGIHIFSGLLHSHLLGRKMRARIFRDGQELPWILHDEHYDFDYQQSRVLREEFILLPGDHVTIECELSSSEREDVTVGGLKTHDEMCEFFVMYYPRVEEMNVCHTNVDFQRFHATFQLGSVHMNWESLDWEVEPTNQTIQEYFRDFDWENFDLEAYQEAVRFDPQPGICGRITDLLEVKDVTFPEYESEYQPPPRQCPLGSPHH